MAVASHNFFNHPNFFFWHANTHFKIARLEQSVSKEQRLAPSLGEEWPLKVISKSGLMRVFSKLGKVRDAPGKIETDEASRRIITGRLSDRAQIGLLYTHRLCWCRFNRLTVWKNIKCPNRLKLGTSTKFFLYFWYVQRYGHSWRHWREFHIDLRPLSAIQPRGSQARGSRSQGQQ